MKTTKLSLFFLCALLVGCSSPSASSGSSAQTSTTPSSSDYSSSDSSHLPGELVNEVTIAAGKYNGGLSADQVAGKAGVALDAPKTYGNLVLLLKAAFGDSMPELSGQRKYGGVYSLPDTFFYSDPKVKAALGWMAGYGLWGNATFTQDDIVSEASLETILKRFLYILWHQREG